MSWGRLVVSLLVPLAVGWLGGTVTARSLQDWYPTLRKPSWNPPDAVFAPVWTLLFLAMGVALYRVWGLGAGDPMVRLAMILFGVQLVLNVLWSVCFFGLRSPGLALVEIAFLWLSVVAMTLVMGRLDPVAGWLLVPYVAWVSFAAVLNGAVWRLNRG
ncbi:MAG TPA: TspO/MBR family protein [Longimicrobiales bacterium]|nr:TspO/MBR family protein [Longimicrobiales bacterium]